VIAAHGLPVQVACRVLGVSESGFYERRTRPPSERADRHAMLTDLISQIHTSATGSTVPAGSMPNSLSGAASRSETTKSSC